MQGSKANKMYFHIGPQQAAWSLEIGYIRPLLLHAERWSCKFLRILHFLRAISKNIFNFFIIHVENFSQAGDAYETASKGFFISNLQRISFEMVQLRFLVPFSKGRRKLGYRAKPWNLGYIFKKFHENLKLIEKFVEKCDFLEKIFFFFRDLR